MKYISTIIIFLLSVHCNGQTLDKYKNDNVVITFDKTEIIDTIYVDSASTEESYTKKYIFNFTNSGSEILIISYTGGCDPCFMDNYPKEPAKPGQKSSIEIACPGMSAKRIIEYDGKEKLVTKHWKINSNAKNEVTLTVRQIFILK